MINKVLFYLFKSINIHDIIIRDEWEKHCVVVPDKHSELSLLIHLSGSFGHGKAGWGIA